MNQDKDKKWEKLNMHGSINQGGTWKRVRVYVGVKKLRLIKYLCWWTILN